MNKPSKTRPPKTFAQKPSGGSFLREEDIVSNDAIMPVQFIHFRRALSPEETLLTAMLEQVKTDLMLVHTKRIKKVLIAWKAHDYVFSEDRLYPLAFLNVCEGLGIDPAAFRDAAWRWLLDPSSVVRRHNRTPSRLRKLTVTKVAA